MEHILRFFQLFLVIMIIVMTLFAFQHFSLKSDIKSDTELFTASIGSTGRVTQSMFESYLMDVTTKFNGDLNIVIEVGTKVGVDVYDSKFYKFQYSKATGMAWQDTNGVLPGDDSVILTKTIKEDSMVTVYIEYTSTTPFQRIVNTPMVMYSPQYVSSFPIRAKAFALVTENSSLYFYGSELIYRIKNGLGTYDGVAITNINVQTSIEIATDFVDPIGVTYGPSGTAVPIPAFDTTNATRLTVANQQPSYIEPFAKFYIEFNKVTGVMKAIQSQ